MANLKPRSDRSDPTRYSPLRETENQKGEATPEPKRPQTVRSAVAGWSQYPDRESQERSALNAIKNANQKQERGQPERPEAKHPEKTKEEQQRDQKAKLSELAERLAPNQQNQDRPRDREQER